MSNDWPLEDEEEKPRRTDAEIKADLDAQWKARVDKDPPPDLHVLALAYDGYSSVPPKAWADYDRRMMEWKARSRATSAK